MSQRRDQRVRKAEEERRAAAAEARNLKNEYLYLCFDFQHQSLYLCFYFQHQHQSTYIVHMYVFTYAVR